MAIDPGFAAELDAVAGEEAGVAQATATETRAGKSNLEAYVADPIKAAGGGILKSIFETKDFLVGEPAEADKSGIRRDVERRTAELGRESPVNALATGISQFATGMLGAGKLMAPIKGIKAVAEAGRGVKTVMEVGRAAAVGAVAFDPHDERLSNLVQHYPFLQNPISEYLQAKPTDSAAEGRFKAALESVGLDVAVLGVLKASVAGYKYLRAGDNAKATSSFAEAAKAIEEADAASFARQGQQAADTAAQGVRDQPKTVGELFAEFRAGERGAGAAAETPLQRAERIRKESLGAEPQVDKAGATPGVAPDMPVAGAARDPAATVSPKGLPEGAVEAVPNLKAADATLPPGGSLKPIAELPIENMPQLMGKIGGDVEALTRYHSREKAVAAGHEFGKGAELPWQMWKTPDDVAAFAARLADTGESALAGRRGASTDKALQRLVNQRVLMFNEKPSDIQGVLAAAGKGAKTLAANLEASTALGIKMTDEAMAVHAKIRAGNLSEWGGSYQAAMDEFGKRVGLSLSMMGHSREMLSGAGRALRRGRGDLERLGVADLKAGAEGGSDGAGAAMASLSSNDLRQLDKLPVQALYHLFSEANGDLRVVSRMLNKPTLLGQATDLANFLRVNNLLWGWKTHVVNAVSNAWMVAARPAERLIGSSILQAAGKVEGNVASSIRTQALREYRYTTSMLWDGLYTALRHWEGTDALKAVGESFKKGDSVINPHGAEYFHQSGGAAGQAFEWKPVGNIGDIFNNALRALEVTVGFPTRALGATDELMKQISYRSVVMAEASMKADALNLQGKAHRDYVSARLEEAFDAKGAAVNEAALREAQIRTFQQDLLPKTWGSSVQHAKANHPSLGLILPFVKTPTNVLRYSVKLTPGLNLIQREYRDMISGRMGVEQQAHAVGQMAMGSLVLGAAATVVEAGVFTGSGPSNANDKRNLLATGWQPNSFVSLNEDGTKTYTPINRFDPIAMPFGIMADILDVIHATGGEESPLYEQAMDAAAALGLSVVNQLKDRTYLQSLTQFIQALNEPDKKAGNLAGNIAGSLVPGATFWKMTSADPYLREVRGIVDGLMANTPGLSEKLPARRDAWGEPLTVRKGFSSSTVDRVVDNEMVRMGLDAEQTFGPINPSQSQAGDLRDFTLEDGRNAYEVLQELSARPRPGVPTLKERAATLFQSPHYLKAIDGERGTKGTKQWMLADLLRKYREPAMQILKSKSPKLREQMQEAELKARSAFATGTKDAQAEGNSKGLQALGAAYGIDLGTMFPKQ